MCTSVTAVLQYTTVAIYAQLITQRSSKINYQQKPMWTVCRSHPYLLVSTVDTAGESIAMGREVKLIIYRGIYAFIVSLYC